MREQREFRGFNLRLVSVPPWKVWLLALVGGTIAITFMVAAAGLFLLLLPVVLVTGVVARLLLGRQQRSARPAAARPEVLEGQYEVVEVERGAGRAQGR